MTTTSALLDYRRDCSSCAGRKMLSRCASLLIIAVVLDVCAGETCSASNPCTSQMRPCCSAYKQCGLSTEHCGQGCQDAASVPGQCTFRPCTSDSAFGCPKDQFQSWMAIAGAAVALLSMMISLATLCCSLRKTKLEIRKLRHDLRYVLR